MQDANLKAIQEITDPAYTALIEGGHYDLVCGHCKKLVMTVSDDDLMEECDADPDYRQALKALHNCIDRPILDAGIKLRDIRNLAASRIISRLFDRLADHQSNHCKGSDND